MEGGFPLKKREPRKTELAANVQPNFDIHTYSHVAPLERVEVAAAESEMQRNCFGTARFLSGENSGGDVYQDSESTVEMLAERAPLPEPLLGCYIVLDGMPEFSKKISHMGVIVSVEPLLMMHRSMRQGPMRVDPVEAVVSHFDALYRKQQIPTYTGIDVRYYANPNTQFPEPENKNER